MDIIVLGIHAEVVGNAGNVAVVHGKEAVADVGRHVFRKGIGAAEADLSGKHRVGIAVGTHKVGHDAGMVDVAFGFQEGHAEARAHIGREAVPGGDVPVHIGKQRLKACFGMHGMTAVSRTLGNSAVGAVFQFRAHGHVEHGGEIIAHRQRAARTGRRFGIGTDFFPEIGKFRLGMLNIQHELGRNVHAHKVRSPGCGGQHEACRCKKYADSLEHEVSPWLKGLWPGVLSGPARTARASRPAQPGPLSFFLTRLRQPAMIIMAPRVGTSCGREHDAGRENWVLFRYGKRRRRRPGGRRTSLRGGRKNATVRPFPAGTGLVRRECVYILP